MVPDLFNIDLPFFNQKDKELLRQDPTTSWACNISRSSMYSLLWMIGEHFVRGRYYGFGSRLTLRFPEDLNYFEKQKGLEMSIIKDMERGILHRNIKFINTGFDQEKEMFTDKENEVLKGGKYTNWCAHISHSNMLVTICLLGIHFSYKNYPYVGPSIGDFYLFVKESKDLERGEAAIMVLNSIYDGHIWNVWKKLS